MTSWIFAQSALLVSLNQLNPGTSGKRDRNEEEATQISTARDSLWKHTSSASKAIARWEALIRPNGAVKQQRLDAGSGRSSSMRFPIDGALYPDQPVPDRLETMSDRIDFLARLFSAWDFGQLPDSATVSAIRQPDWQESVDATRLLTSPAYHLLTALARAPRGTFSRSAEPGHCRRPVFGEDLTADHGPPGSRVQTGSAAGYPIRSSADDRLAVVGGLDGGAGLRGACIVAAFPGSGRH